MKQQSLFTKCSLIIFILFLLILLNLFIQVIPIKYLDLAPIHIFFGLPILALIGGIFSIIGLIRQKTKLSIFLIIINFILLFFSVGVISIFAYLFSMI